MKKGKNNLDDKIVNIVIFRNMKINIHGYLFIFLKDFAKSVLVDSYQFTTFFITFAIIWTATAGAHYSIGTTT